MHSMISTAATPAPRGTASGRSVARAAATGGLALLITAGAVAGGSGAPAAAAPAANDVTAARAQPGDPVLRLGSTGDAVSRLQRLLGMRPTGYFGDSTLSRVLSYQKSHGIPATGVVATLTWGALNGSSAPAASGRPVLSIGMRNEWVKALQVRLRMPLVTGYFGSMTLGYVQAVQRQARLPVTGVVDNKTWRKASRIRVSVPAPSAAPSPAPAPASGKAAKVLAVAASLRGIPYVANGYTPAAGFNCSSYTQWVYSKAGINLGGAYTVTQYNQSRKISRGQARPGDLVFMYNYANNFIGHVGIYAGNGMFWHAPRPGRVVSLDSIYTDKVYFGRVL